MSCGNYQCRYQGYCDCEVRAQREISDSGFSLIFMLIGGVISPTFYPAWKIFRAYGGYDPQTGEPEFVGTGWLFLSIVCGFFAVQMLSIILTVAACSTQTINNTSALLMYGAAMNGTFALTLLLALLVWLWRNKSALGGILRAGHRLITTWSGWKTVGRVAIALLVLVWGSYAGYWAVYSVVVGANIKAASAAEQHDTTGVKPKHSVNTASAKQPKRK